MRNNRRNKNNKELSENNLKSKYDNNRIMQIKLSFDSKNYDEVGALINNYVLDYPNDMTVYIYYSRYLQELGFFDKAEEVLDFVLDKDDFYQSRVWGLYLVSLTNNLLYQNRYAEAFMLLDKYDDLINTHDKRFEEKYQYAAIMGGYKNKIDEKSNMYSRINNYSNFHTLLHIDHRHIGSGMINSFVPDFPFIKVYKYIKENLEYCTRLYQHGVYNVYYFKAPACGYCHGKKVDYIKVVTLKDTDKIYTMYPTYKCTNFTPNELPFDFEYKSGKEVKRLSQVEKFNKKYGNN